MRSKEMSVGCSAAQKPLVHLLSVRTWSSMCSSIAYSCAVLLARPMPRYRSTYSGGAGRWYRGPSNLLVIQPLHTAQTDVASGCCLQQQHAAGCDWSSMRGRSFAADARMDAVAWIEHEERLAIGLAPFQVVDGVPHQHALHPPCRGSTRARRDVRNQPCQHQLVTSRSACVAAHSPPGAARDTHTTYLWSAPACR